VETVKRLKPDYVIQIGDLYDMYSWSKFPFKRDLYTPKDELARGREMAEEMWTRLRKAAGPWKCKFIQMKGNHDERPTKRLLEKAPEFMSLMDDPLHELFKFKGVSTQREERDDFVLDGIVFMHGFRSKLGDHARHNGMSTVVGHSHRGGSIFLRLGAKTIWELNAGFCGDEHSVPMSYTRQTRTSTWTQGFAVVDEHGPRFIPLEN